MPGLDVFPRDLKAVRASAPRRYDYRRLVCARPCNADCRQHMPRHGILDNHPCDVASILECAPRLLGAVARLRRQLDLRQPADSLGAGGGAKRATLLTELRRAVGDDVHDGAPPRERLGRAGLGAATLVFGETDIDLRDVVADVQLPEILKVDGQVAAFRHEVPCEELDGRLLGRLGPAVGPRRAVEKRPLANADVRLKRPDRLEEGLDASVGEHVGELARHGYGDVGYQHVARVVEAEGKLAVDVLLAVLRAHLGAKGPEAREEAAWSCDLDAVVGRLHERRHGAASRLPHVANPLRIHLRARYDIVYRPHAVPDAQERGRPVDQRAAKPHFDVSRARLLAQRGAALPLIVWIEHEGDKTLPRRDDACSQISQAVLA